MNIHPTQLSTQDLEPGPSTVGLAKAGTRHDPITTMEKQTMNRSKTTLSILATVAIVTLVAAVSANAAVIIQSSYDNDGQALVPTDDGFGNFSYTFDSLGSFTASGAEKLVLGYTSRNENSGAGAAPATITYGTVELTEAAQLSANRGRTGIWYLDNITTDGDLMIDFGTDGATAYVGFSLFALDGLVSGGPTDGGTSITGSTPPEVIRGSLGGFALSTAVRNNQSLSGDGAYTVDYDYSSGGNMLLSQHIVASGAGDYTASVGNVNTMSITAFGWDAPVPEPSTALLAGLGLAGVCLRRWRK